MSEAMKTVRIAVSVILLGVVVVLWSHALTHPTSLLSWHIIFMSSAFLLLMPQAILTINSPWTTSMNRTRRITIHALLHFLALLCASIGFGLIYQAKNNLEINHFESAHGFWGLVTIVSMYVVVVGGVLANNSHLVRKIVKPAVIKVVHSYFGCVVYLMAMFTIIWIVMSDWWDEQFSPAITVGVLVAIVSSTVFVLYRPLVACGARFNAAFKGGNKARKTK